MNWLAEISAGQLDVAVPLFLVRGSVSGAGSNPLEVVMFSVRFRTLGLVAIALLIGCGGSTQEELSTGNGGFAGAAGGSAGIAGASQGGSGTAGNSSDAGPVDAGNDVAQDGTVADVSIDTDAGVADALPSEASLFDQSMPDVALPDGATAQGCYDCTTDKCHDEVAACDADPKCRTLLTCLFVDQCFGGPNGVNNSCAFGCASKAGVTDPTDPAVSEAMAAGKCSGSKCKTECGG